MADDASHLQHLTDSEFLNRFNSACPQETPWILYQCQPKMITSMASTLQRRGNCKQMLCPPNSTLALHGAVGGSSTLKSMSRPTLQVTPIPFKSSKSTLFDSTKDDMTRGARLPSELTPFLNTSQPLSRRTPSWWTRPYPEWASGKQGKTNTSQSVTSCMPLPKQIMFPTEYGSSTPPSSSKSLACPDPQSSPKNTGGLSANSQPWDSTTSSGLENEPGLTAEPRTMTL